ncbi:MAG: UvrD-helicase domain-containing protein [Rhodomicrobium sp.]|nr:UvrD-helicase domain-containing protein [Rhodomicrobium sp.]
MSGQVLDFPPPDMNGVREEARRQQRLAADPANSAWVSANAGTGKTYVLVLRVLRLLLAGAPIENILCLTFTKAAAAEMSNRLIARLGKWAAMPDDALGAELADILQRSQSAEELAFARCLFAKVLDAPGGLKIMTIHAFCDRVLRRFPLEAGVPPGFAILTEEEQAALLQEASDAVLNEAASDPESPMGRALVSVVAHAAEERFRDLVKAVASRRDTLVRLIREQDGPDPFDGIEAVLRDALGAGRTDTPETILAEQAALARDSLIARAIAMLREGKSTDNSLAYALTQARGKPDAVRVEALSAAFLTKEGESAGR